MNKSVRKILVSGLETEPAKIWRKNFQEKEKSLKVPTVLKVKQRRTYDLRRSDLGEESLLKECIWNPKFLKYVLLPLSCAH